MPTDKYELNEYPTGLTNWCSAMNDDMEALDTHIHSYLRGTLGEAFSAYQAGYVKSDGKFWKAQAGKGKPALGLITAAGSASDAKNFQRVGPITNGSWTWSPGVPVWLDPTTPGALTQTRPSNPYKRQFIGIPSSATTLILNIVPDADSLMTTTSTTTTSTTTSTTTTTTTSSSTTTTTSSSTSSTTTTTTSPP